MSSVFSGQFPVNSTVKKLLSLRKKSATDDKKDDWSEKAVKSLAKKLKNGALEELSKAIATQDPGTKCVEIKRSLDGRLQVNQKKGWPHVIYCRLWRYPELQSHHQLKSLPHCQYQFGKKLPLVCVNPFHYVKIDHPALPPIYVPKLAATSSGHFSEVTLTGEDSTNDDEIPEEAKRAESAKCSALLLSASVKQEEASFSDFLDRAGVFSVNGDSFSPLSIAVEPSSVPANVNFPLEASLGSDLISSPFSSTESPQTGYLSEDMDTDLDQSPDSVLTSPMSQNTSELQELGNLMQVPYCDTPNWCSIDYWELNQKIGEAFHASQPSVSVDGYCAPSDSERFCLGLLSNVNRNPGVFEARKHIGLGLRLFYVGGEVFVECRSESAIFIQSSNCNERHGWHPATVCKVPTGCSLKIFDNQDFYRKLSASVPKGYQAVNDLLRMCTIRVSFVKGWGADYRRQTITATPCWIELRLNGPLQWVDRVIMQMRPVSDISS